MLRFLRIFTFIWCLHLSCCSWNFSKIIKTDEDFLARTEETLLKNLIQETKGNKNFILLTDSLDIPCIKSSCEKYDLIDLRGSLRKRGIRQYKGEIGGPYSQLIEFKYRNGGSNQRDIVILSISYFNREVSTIINDIREYDALSYILVLVAGEDSYLSLKFHILAEEIYNIYIAKKSTHRGIYLFYEVCAFCNAGKTEIKFFNSWNRGEGFGRMFKFKSSFRGQFFGAKIKSGLKIAAPHTFPIGLSRNRSVILGGQDYWLLKYLSEALNFEINIYQPRSNRVCRTEKPEESLKGVCEMLYEKEVQLAGFPVAIDEFSFHYFAPTAVYFMFNTVLISANPALEDSVSFTLNSTTLLTVFVLYIIIVLTMYTIERFQRSGDKSGFITLWFDAFATMCLEAVQFGNLHIGRSIVAGVWIVSCFFIISTVFGEITSAAAVKNPLTTYINTLEDMKERDISWIVPPTQLLDAFLAKQLPKQAKFKKVMGVTEGLKYVLKNPSKYVYLYAKEAADPLIRLGIWNGKGTNPFHFSPPLVGDIPWMLTIYQQKGSPFKDALTMGMLRNEAAGLLRGKYMPDTLNIIARSSKLDKGYKEKDQYSEVSVIYSMMYFFAACLCLLMSSLISFICEKLNICMIISQVIKKIGFRFLQR